MLLCIQTYKLLMNIRAVVMNETQKPFACGKEGCKMAFTNEDHLNVHKKKHDMALHLGIDSQNNSVVADETPTPTRFIRNCEEVGLFQDLQNVNPFDETFRKAAELAKTGTLHIPETSADDTLHTPHIFPHIEEENNSSKFSRNNSNEPQFTVTTINEDLLKLTNKSSDESMHNINTKNRSKSNIHSEVLSLTDESSDSEKRNDFLIQSSSIIEDGALISKDNLISNNVRNIVPFPIPLTDSDLPPVVVNNLSDIEISINRNDVIHRQSHSVDTQGNMEAEETIKSKLKEALINRVKTEDCESDDHDTILIQKIESSSLFTNTQPQLIKPLQKRVLSKHSNEENPKIKASKSSTCNAQNILIHDGPQKRNLGSLKRSRIFLPQNQLERQREINRAAQVRSRERKKYWISQMEAEIALLKEEKKELWLDNQNLKDEIVWLKTMLLYHKDCPISKDPQIMEEINTLVKATKEELQKKMQKNPLAKKVVPIRPNPPNVIALTPVSNSMFMQVPAPLDSAKGTIQVATLPTLANPTTSAKAAITVAASTMTTTLPKLVPCSVVSSGQDTSKQNSSKMQIPSTATSNIIIGIVSHPNSTVGNSKDHKKQSKIVKAKNKLKIDCKKDKKLRNIKVNPSNVIQLPNAILSEDNYFVVTRPSEIEKPKNTFQSS